MLSIEHAREEAEHLLSDDEFFQSITGTMDTGAFDEFATELQRLLRTYEVVNCSTGAAQIARSAVRPTDLDNSLIEIGCNERAKVVVRRGEESVREIDDQGRFPPWLPGALPSVWHWILWVHFINEHDPTSDPIKL